VPDTVDLHRDRFGHIVPDQLEERMADLASNICLAIDEIVVEPDHLLASLNQPVHQVRPTKPAPPVIRLRNEESRTKANTYNQLELKPLLRLHANQKECIQLYSNIYHRQGFN
jgi:hypothetical protein